MEPRKKESLLQHLLESGESITSAVIEYVETRFELFKLDIQEDVLGVLSNVMRLILISVASIFFIFFASFALAAWLNSITGVSHLGYWIITGIYGLMLLILLVVRRSLGFKRFLYSFLIELLKSREKDKEKDN